MNNGPMIDQPERLRVLVVDDEPNIVDVVSMALRHGGFDVAAADTGAEVCLSMPMTWAGSVC